VYEVLHRLFYQREKPIMILSVLSGCYVDLYRAKAAASAGVPAESLAAEFKYRGREFVLRNAARDSARLSLPTLAPLSGCAGTGGYAAEIRTRLGKRRIPQFPRSPCPRFPAGGQHHSGLRLQSPL